MAIYVDAFCFVLFLVFGVVVLWFFRCFIEFGYVVKTGDGFKVVSDISCGSDVWLFFHLYSYVARVSVINYLVFWFYFFF